MPDVGREQTPETRTEWAWLDGSKGTIYLHGENEADARKVVERGTRLVLLRREVTDWVPAEPSPATAREHRA